MGLRKSTVNKAGGCKGISAELFKTPEDDAYRHVTRNMSENLEDPGLKPWPQEKVNPHPNFQEGQY